MNMFQAFKAFDDGKDENVEKLWCHNRNRLRYMSGSPSQEQAWRRDEAQFDMTAEAHLQNLKARRAHEIGKTRRRKKKKKKMVGTPYQFYRIAVCRFVMVIRMEREVMPIPSSSLNRWQAH